MESTRRTEVRGGWKSHLVNPHKETRSLRAHSEPEDGEICSSSVAVVGARQDTLRHHHRLRTFDESHRVGVDVVVFLPEQQATS